MPANQPRIYPWQHEYKPSRSIPPPTPPSHRRSAAPPPAAAAPPLPLQSDRPPNQPRTTSSIELPPYAAPRPCQPLKPLPVTAPLLGSTCHPQAGVSSSRKKEWETTLHDGEEKREEKLIELNRMLNKQEKEKENDSTARREEEVNRNFPKLIENEIKAEALRSSLEMKEKDLSVLPEKPSKNEKMEIQSLVEEHKAAFEIQKNDLEVEMEEKRRLFENEIRLKTEELVMKESAISHTMKILKKRGQTCAFDPGDDIDFEVLNQVGLLLNVKKFASEGDIVVEVSRIDEVDDKPAQGKSKKPKLAKDVYIGYAIVGYWRIKQRSCPFDPGGIPRQAPIIDSLRCFMVSTLRTRWVSTVGELIRALFSLDKLGICISFPYICFLVH